MKPKRNRRTLKKRIRNVLNFNSLITVLFISCALIALALSVSKVFLQYQGEMVASAILEDINSGNAAKALGIASIDRMNMNNPKSKMWVDSLDKKSMLNDFFLLPENEKNVIIEIELNHVIVYTNGENADETLDVDLKHISEHTQAQTQVEKPIYDKDHNTIGYVRVKVNAKFILGILGLELGVIILLGVAALILSKIISMFLIIPIINPINQLEKKVKAIAEGDQETATNTQLELKRPLREIESLINSTNGIMRRLHGYNDLLESQKETLESQKGILESQKGTLESQKDTLENQNFELEMQNEELLLSKQHIQEQQGQLVQSEKMASVGMLTAAITHEINTPIGAINSNAQMEQMLLLQLMSQKEFQQDDEISSLLIQLKEVNDVNLIACSRIIEIIKSLKTYSRIDQAAYQECSIVDCMKSVLVLTKNLLKNRVVIHEDYEELPYLKCFPGQLNQVFMNIVVNASQAIEGEGELFIHAYQNDNNVYISIKDTGIGIKHEDITKIFDPGFTTKGVGVGLGLGLYISYNIIQKHQGDITVNSEFGQGTEFIIRIPMNIAIIDHNEN